MLKSDLRFTPSPRQCTRAPKKTDDRANQTGLMGSQLTSAVATADVKKAPKTAKVASVSKTAAKTFSKTTRANQNSSKSCGIEGHAKYYPPLTELVTNVRLMGENVITATQTYKLTLDSASLKNSDAYTIPTPASFTTGIRVVGDEMKRTDDSFEGGNGCTAKVCATIGFCG